VIQCHATRVFVVCLAVLGAAFSEKLTGQTPPPVPAAYQDLYTAMQGSIDSFNATTLASWDGTKGPVIFSGHLQTINSNQGVAILDPSNYQSFLVELNGLKALGVTGVVLNIDYPILDPNFDSWGGQAANFLTLYTNAAKDIRARGLKVIVETGGIFSDPMFSAVNVSPYYAKLSTVDYMKGRAQQALVIAQQVQPDYLNVVAEPDTEAEQSAKPELYTYTGSMQLLNTILGVLRPANVTPKIGAGIGTWLATDSEGKTYTDYINGYASTSVDSIDMHVYPVIRTFLTRMPAIAAIAQNANKRLTITEAWSFKERDSEAGVLSTGEIYSRDVFSFWGPLDDDFLRAMTNFSHWQKLDVMAAFWTGYFRSYLDYSDSTSAMTPSQLYDAVHPLQSSQMSAGAYSTTGTNWLNLVRSSPDTTAPSPAVVTSTVYPNQVLLSWDWPDDNVGVAKFTVWRSGVPRVTTVQTAFTEAGLLDGHTYTYWVAAWDASNNKKSMPLTITTLDITPPSPPTVLTAVVSSGAVQLAWSGAKDNVGVTGYKIYRGANGAAITGFASVDGTPSGYIDSSIYSNTSYCYYVVSQDAVGFLSTPSPTACATAPDAQAPYPPSDVNATLGSAPQVMLTWSAATDAGGVVGYNIQRSLNDGPFAPLASNVKALGYTDNTAVALPDKDAPAVSVSSPEGGAVVDGNTIFLALTYDTGTPTAYQYQVDAFDAAGNVSVWSGKGRAYLPTVASGIARVEFFVDGVRIAELTESPYYVTWNTKTATNGIHTLTITATDNAGNSTTAAPVVVSVQN
jgi:fibronectin type 3 domain-containing protein